MIVHAEKLTMEERVLLEAAGHVTIQPPLPYDAAQSAATSALVDRGLVARALEDDQPTLRTTVLGELEAARLAARAEALRRFGEASEAYLTNLAGYRMTSASYARIAAQDSLLAHLTNPNAGEPPRYRGVPVTIDDRLRSGDEVLPLEMVRDHYLSQVKIDEARVSWSDMKDREEKLQNIVRAFVEKHDITCAETIHQNDRVVVEATSLIEQLVEVVGYKKFEEDED